MCRRLYFLREGGEIWLGERAPSQYFSHPDKSLVAKKKDTTGNT